MDPAVDSGNIWPHESTDDSLLKDQCYINSNMKFILINTDRDMVVVHTCEFIQAREREAQCSRNPQFDTNPYEIGSWSTELHEQL